MSDPSSPAKVRFADFGLRPELNNALDEAGFTEPTPIQAQAIPLLLRGGDLVGVAETGTGKTAAFLLPMLNSMEPGTHDPRALIICPTRELAMQVAGEARRFGSAIGDNAQIEKLVRLERKLADIGDDPVSVIDVSTAEVTVR